MPKSLTHRQFLQMWFNRMGIKNKAVQSHMDDIYEGLIEVIREELRTKGELNIRNLGKFYIIETGGYEVKNAGLTKVNDTYFIERHYLPKFSCSQNFKDYVNHSVASKEGRRKVKNGSWTERSEDMLMDTAERRRKNVRKMLEHKRNTGDSFCKMVKELNIKTYKEILDEEDDEE